MQEAQPCDRCQPDKAGTQQNLCVVVPPLTIDLPICTQNSFARKHAAPHLCTVIMHGHCRQITACKILGAPSHKQRTLRSWRSVGQFAMVIISMSRLAGVARLQHLSLHQLTMPPQDPLLLAAIGQQGSLLVSSLKD
jgi:hypothetical protein